MNFKELKDKFTQRLRARSVARDQQLLMEGVAGRMQADMAMTNRERVLAKRYEKLQEYHTISIPTLIRRRQEAVARLHQEPGRSDLKDQLQSIDSEIAIRVADAYHLAGEQ